MSIIWVSLLVKLKVSDVLVLVRPLTYPSQTQTHLAIQSVSLCSETLAPCFAQVLLNLPCSSLFPTVPSSWWMSLQGLTPCYGVLFWSTAFTHPHTPLLKVVKERTSICASRSPSLRTSAVRDSNPPPIYFLWQIWLVLKYEWQFPTFKQIYIIHLTNIASQLSTKS